MDNTEQKASEQGWNPNFEGEGKLSAEQYLEKGEKIAGIAIKHRDELKERVEVLERDNTELRQVTKQYGDDQRALRQKDRERSERTIVGLKAELEEAVNQSDGANFTRLNKEIDKHERNLAPEADAISENAYNQMANKWSTDNSWYKTNTELTDYADAVANRLQREGKTGQFYFDEITRNVKKMFPDEFENKNRRGANDVESGGNREAPSSKAQSYENLPSWAKEACDKFVRTGITTKEAYVNDFEWE